MPLAAGSSQPDRGLAMRGPLTGSLRPPDSESFAQRLLVAAALAAGRTTLVGSRPRGQAQAGASDFAEDVANAVEFIRGLGAEVACDGDGRWSVCGVAEGGSGHAVASCFDVGESGTLARIATAVLALRGPSGQSVSVSARGTLRSRGSHPLVMALRGAGARLSDGWPMTIERARSVPDRLEIASPISSQEVSALWIAAATLRGAKGDGRATRILVEGTIPSSPYLDITREVLARFGVQVDPVGDGMHDVRVRGPLVAPENPILIEADASAAAVALAAGCLSRGDVRIEGIPPDSVQGDTRIVEFLRAFGCEAIHTGDGMWATGFPTRGAELDLSDQPDLAPVLVAVAAGATQSGERSVFTGLASLRRKESDRLDALAEFLTRCGFAAHASDSDLVVGPLNTAGGSHAGAAGPVRLHPRSDHRIAFTAALLGLLRDGVTVSDAACVAKSWPGFWGDMRSLGASVFGD